jgi:glycerate 2-kinase
MDYRKIAEQIFMAGVNRVTPDRLIHNLMTLNETALNIGDHKFVLKKTSNIYIIGAGKATAEMARATEDILGSRITGGHIVVKYGHSCSLKYITVTEAGHPVPDKNGFMATGEILKIADKASEDDLVICLLSGGGSALLADFPEGSSPDEMIYLNNLLVKSGATIQEMNVIRKHLSKVKGGGLARTLCPSTIVSLILSDVLGDPLDAIASGPTVPDPSTFSESLAIIYRYKIEASVPSAIMNYLKDGVNGKQPETPKPGDPIFNKSHNILIGNNKMALEAARGEALRLCLEATIIDNNFQGDTAKASENVVGTALSFKRHKRSSKPACLLFGGETTLKVTGSGLGGRNQHFALSAAILLRNKPGITILSAGTDGTDGPTDSAGAIVDSDTCNHALLVNADPEKYLREFDSYNFFRITGGHIITSPTRTNVMDIIVVIVE